MSKKIYRKDKTCLNCNYVVADKFCPNCGQENSDTRKTFHHLFVHFFEDLTHYENAFWRTIKNLLFRPASLTKEYLSGKRLSYLAPIRLYIFVSFITFFITAFLPNEEITTKTKDKKENYNSDDYGLIFIDTQKASEKTADSITQKKRNDSIAIAHKEIQKFLDANYISKNNVNKFKKLINDSSNRKNNNSAFAGLGYNSMKELDSVKKHVINNGKKMSNFEYWFLKKITKLGLNNTNEELKEKAEASFKSNIPKVLIIYMPIFALFLWLFQSKKTWYYFDHGIFTLHYFSFLLLIILINSLLMFFLNSFVATTFSKVLGEIIGVVTFVWSLYYFFAAHYRFYGQSRLTSFIKALALFFINSFFIIITLILFFIYNLLNIT